ncbi:hypothetical protein CAOG_08642 [Capsaspora owczarzaki ATCC 30864]|uniref:Uncharacterized protein n=1 Tax=Capsaspora owczarzaki (strain ATCC 30864) TaxID=595528 RepID=A0A0D2VNB9_CAPO3|nr:hypothetical protein CAOG_08642 [Capsaspora owczarzaki ATCC 30864]KJE91792.1 hypothetical protein CAOG_008642 [Capsaspora owczarzaki ATCC 30864]|eukprot:XP_011270253.1 hypothetical protein CAOG_08642 [Capsaspora owczarzaki ATCC 30864]
MHMGGMPPAAAGAGGWAPIPSADFAPPGPAMQLEGIRPFSMGPPVAYGSGRPAPIGPAGFGAAPALLGQPPQQQQQQQMPAAGVWHNAITKQSVWEKPNELKTIEERVLADIPWTEHQNDQGRPYYHNKQTKETTWTLPEQLKVARERIAQLKAEADARPPAVVAPMLPPVAADGGPARAAHGEMAPMTGVEPLATVGGGQAPNLAAAAGSAAGGPTSSASAGALPSLDPSFGASSLPEIVVPISEEARAELRKMRERFSAPNATVDSLGVSPADAKRLFKEVLRERGIGSTWTWENTLKQLTTDPLLNLLKTPGERKQALNEYKTVRVKEEKEESYRRQKLARAELRTFFEKAPQISSRLHWQDAATQFRDLPVFRAVEGDSSRREAFEAAMSVIRDREREQARIQRTESLARVSKMYAEIPNFSFRTLWAEAYEHFRTFEDTLPEKDPIRQLLNLDLLQCFQEAIAEHEKEQEQVNRGQRDVIRREQRKIRDGYQALLDELENIGIISATSKWKDVYSALRVEPRFTAVLPLSAAPFALSSCSSALDLFKLHLEKLQVKAEQERQLVITTLKVHECSARDRILTYHDDEILLVLQDLRVEITATSSFQDFFTLAASDPRLKALSSSNLASIHSQLVAKAKAETSERERLDELRQQKRAKAFMKMLRGANPPLSASSTYDEIVQRFGQNPAFLVIPTDEQRLELMARTIHQIENQELAVSLALAFTRP